MASCILPYFMSQAGDSGKDQNVTNCIAAGTAGIAEIMYQRLYSQPFFAINSETKIPRQIQNWFNTPIDPLTRVLKKMNTNW